MSSLPRLVVTVKGVQPVAVEQLPCERVEADQQVDDRQREEADVGGLGKPHPQEHRDVCRVGKHAEQGDGAGEEVVVNQGEQQVHAVAHQGGHKRSLWFRRVHDRCQIPLDHGWYCGHSC